jgi:hypothetical protein
MLIALTGAGCGGDGGNGGEGEISGQHSGLPVPPTGKSTVGGHVRLDIRSASGASVGLSVGGAKAKADTKPDGSSDSKGVEPGKRPVAVAVPASQATSPEAASPIDLIFDPGTARWRNPEFDVDAQFREIHKLGGTTIRLRIDRETDLAMVDRAVSAAAMLGMKVLMTPTGGSLEAPWVATPAASAAFADFVGVLGRRYKDVKRWAIYNEPNLMLDKGSFNTAGDAYRDLYQRSQQALAKGGHSWEEVLIGEVAPHGRPNEQGSSGYDRESVSKFMRDLFLEGAKLRTGGWAAHPYSGMGTYSRMGDLEMMHQELVRAARRGGVRGIPDIYVTEWGVLGAKPNAGRQRLRGQRQAMALPYVKSFAQYLLQTDSGFDTGLIDTLGNRKPQYYSFPGSLGG